MVDVETLYPDIHNDGDSTGLNDPPVERLIRKSLFTPSGLVWSDPSGSLIFPSKSTYTFLSCACIRCFVAATLGLKIEKLSTVKFYMLHETASGEFYASKSVLQQLNRN